MDEAIVIAEQAGAVSEAVLLAQQVGAVVGLTELFTILIPKAWGKYVNPWIAMILGVLAIVGPKLAAGEPATPEDVFAGIVLGGSVTGLYKVVRKK